MLRNTVHAVLVDNPLQLACHFHGSKLNYCSVFRAWEPSQHVDFRCGPLLTGYGFVFVRLRRYCFTRCYTKQMRHNGQDMTSNVNRFMKPSVFQLKCLAPELLLETLSNTELL